MGAIEPLSEVRAGALLLAVPMLRDPNFKRTVVLLCEHTEDGSFGLVLNRPLGVTAGDLVGGLKTVRTAVGIGGPVQNDTMHYLHRFGEAIPDAEHVVEDVWWGGDFEQVRELLETDQPPDREIRFYLGYSGWEKGQLLEEIDEGAWIVVPATAQLLFDVAPEKLWGTVLKGMGGTFALMANFPEDPRLN